MVDPGGWGISVSRSGESYTSVVKVCQTWTVEGHRAPRMMIPEALNFMSADGSGTWYTAPGGLFRYSTT